MFLRHYGLILLVLVFMNCWNDQDNEITAPKTPNYTVSGGVFDIDSHEIMQNSIITLNAVELIYEVDFVAVTDTTDSAGHYSFSNITPGTYQIEAKRGRYNVLSESIVVQHEDKYQDLELPKVILADAYYQPSSANGSREYPRLNGIHWKDSGTLAGVWQWKDWGDDPGGRWRVVTGFFGSPFTIIGERNFRTENSEFWGITYLINYWVCGGSGFNSKIYIIYPGDGRISGQIDVPYDMLDLTNDGTNIWGISSNGKAIKYSVHASLIEAIYDVENPNPSGIAWDGSTIWTSDKVVNYVYQHAADFSINKTYLPYLDAGFGNITAINGLKYLTFDVNGRLWASDGYTVYRFQKVEQ